MNSVVKEKGKTKYGYPHHPTGLAYEQMTFELFDMDEYINNMER